MGFSSVFQGGSVVLWAGEKARALHGAWLTRALAGGAKFPVIPTRRVSDGGFGTLMSTAAGRAWAQSWWDRALGSLDDEL